MTREEVLSKFDGVKGGGDQYYARCPAHPDKKQSLSILFAASGKTAFTCHAGCVYREIIAAAGLQESDTFPDKPHDPNPKKSYAKVIDTYDYHFAAGGPLAQKLRKDDKTFSWRHKDASGNWVWKKPPEPIPPYNLPAVQAADLVYIVEGEKDANTLIGYGLVATTGADGAGNR